MCPPPYLSVKSWKQANGQREREAYLDVAKRRSCKTCCRRRESGLTDCHRATGRWLALVHRLPSHHPIGRQHTVKSTSHRSANTSPPTCRRYVAEQCSTVETCRHSPSLQHYVTLRIQRSLSAIIISSCQCTMAPQPPTWQLFPCAPFVSGASDQNGGRTMIDWVRLNVPPTQYRSYGDGFLRVKWPNQQCQSTEGTLNQIEQNTTIHLN